MVPFNIPLVTGRELDYIKEVLQNRKLCGDGFFSKKCHDILENRYNTGKAMLTTSCTHALEMAALLADIVPGDEVIMPSYTFVSSANAFLLRGATPVFVDVRPDTMNIDEKLIEDAVTEKTKVIVVMHYGGVSCEMAEISRIAEKYNLLLIEDAAQAIGAKYGDSYLGTIGDFGTISFHETKNISCGEGGALFINRPEYYERAEIIREKGTNRTKFLRGEIDKYTWVDIGSSYLPDELNAACLLAQLEDVDGINNTRIKTWNRYREGLDDFQKKGIIELQNVPENCIHNGHLFYIKCSDIEKRQSLIDYLKSEQIYSVFHYIPLHSSPKGMTCGRFNGEDRYTTKESERLLRLPMWYGLADDVVDSVIASVKEFFRSNS